MNVSRLTKNIFNIITNNKMKTSWIKETMDDLRKLNIPAENVLNRKKSFFVDLRRKLL